MKFILQMKFRWVSYNNKDYEGYEAPPYVSIVKNLSLFLVDPLLR